MGGEAGAGGDDQGTPPAGFYSLRAETITDTCTPAAPAGVVEQHTFVRANATGVNVALLPVIGRQDILFSKPVAFTMPECGTSYAVAVTSADSGSFVVDSTWNFVDFSACNAAKPSDIAGLPIPYTPQADCTLHQRLTYELVQACPATVDGLSCPAGG